MKIISVSEISTHTPHARRDYLVPEDVSTAIHISTHTPLARRDDKFGLADIIPFISTHTPLARRD